MGPITWPSIRLSMSSTGRSPAVPPGGAPLPAKGSKPIWLLQGTTPCRSPRWLRRHRGAMHRNILQGEVAGKCATTPTCSVPKWAGVMHRRSSARISLALRLALSWIIAVKLRQHAGRKEGWQVPPPLQTGRRRRCRRRCMDTRLPEAKRLLNWSRHSPWSGAFGTAKKAWPSMQRSHVAIARKSSTRTSRVMSSICLASKTAWTLLR
mmetsp:Transcript_132925/g.187831  ORF Transcript_132925/g.187831 Transcript_132925/m.187831 type:complete len:208 (+) Transcript_132925:515-1138(+)